MTTLTRRRDPDRPGCWQIHYGDIRVGTITERGNGPRDIVNWDWICGFYLGTEPGQYRSDSAATFEIARIDFEAAWQALPATRIDADFQTWRDAKAFTAWKYAMWEAGAKLPTQAISGASRCFCGVSIDITGMATPVQAAHPFRPN
jgi:hypothetical protein